jgi:PEP-CTERM motif-containing protein
MKTPLSILLSVCLTFTASMVWAGTATDIRRPPVSSNVGFPDTGPTTVDPQSLQGQWFSQGGIAGTESVRSHEFYDNLNGAGGSALKSTWAIEGYVQNIQWQGTVGDSAILGFDILATVTNDLGLADPSLAALGANAHGELILPGDVAWYNDATPMFDTILTGEFAIDASIPSPGNIGPYTSLSPAIVAINHDQLAWYCWAEEWLGEPHGDFQVPAWDFGDILPGQSATELLQFTISDQTNGLQDSDVRWQAITDSEENGDDILMNRSTSLKISNWVDALAIDTGTPYPQGAQASSDSSVFFNTIPEPSTLVNLGLGALMLLGLALRRRARK